MVKSPTCLTILLLILVAPVFGCNENHALSTVYSSPESHIDREIDTLLASAEDLFLLSAFQDALVDVEKAEVLLSFARDENDYKKLRSSFDKALIVTCLEGPNKNSYVHFAAFNALLESKRCSNSAKSQPDLFDKNGHWPILGSDTKISIEDCLDRVSNTAKALEIATAVLKIHPGTRMTIAAAIYTITQRAKGCCTQEGFWKTCVQSVLDAWKRAELFGIPPDPTWD